MTVSQYFPEKGFGFAKTFKGEKYFFHISDNVENDNKRKNQKVLQTGQKIFSFKMEDSLREFVQFKNPLMSYEVIFSFIIDAT